ncbi:MAG: M14 family metallopeptidase [Thermoanaerobaculia bacterium]
MDHARTTIVSLAACTLLAGTGRAPAAAPSNGAAAARPAAVAALPFDHILRHAELTALLKSWASARPGLVTLESLGTTPGGREMWFLTLTNRATGPASEKPALLVDGHTHATESAGGVAALHLVWRLLRDHGPDEKVTRLLDTRTVYVLPRLTPDGVEQALAEGRFLRSVGRSHSSARPAPGLYMRDLDGDGTPAFMRLRDPNGPWKKHPAEPRLLVPREPDETGGEYWRVLPEGLVEGWDGETIADPPTLEPLDFGSNFPGEREAGARAPHAGPYPGSEPEVAAYVAAIERRPNIVVHVTCHTFGGLVLTPPVNRSERLPEADRRAYEALAARAARRTGYEAMSYLALRGETAGDDIPSAFGWIYDQKGIYSFITEFWNPLRAAGISLEGTTASAWLWGFHPVEEELKLLRWSDEALGGKAFVPWHPFDHPQLGRVEIGGWDKIGAFYNVPFDRLEKEVAPHTEWLIESGLSLPSLAVRSLGAEPAGAGLWCVRLVVENTGWLPTNGTQRAADRRAAAEVAAELSLPPAARLVTGEARKTLGHLAGRNEQRSTATWWSYRPGTPDRALAEWLVAAPTGTKLSVTAGCDRAGTVRGEVMLGR